MSDQLLVPRAAPTVVEVDAEVEPNPGRADTGRPPVVVVHESSSKLTGIPAAIVLIATGLVVLVIGLMLASIVRAAATALGYKPRPTSLGASGAAGSLGRRRQ